MSNPPIEKEKIESREVNYVRVNIGLESGCDPLEGEYTMHISSFLGYLDIGSIGGVDDVTLIKEAVQEALPDIDMPEEGMVHLVLKESGEWEDVFWHKYYIVERVNVDEY